MSLCPAVSSHAQFAGSGTPQASVTAELVLGGSMAPPEQLAVIWALQRTTATGWELQARGVSARWQVVVPVGDYRLEARLGAASVQRDLTLDAGVHDLLLDMDASLLRAELVEAPPASADIEATPVWTARGDADAVPIAFSVSDRVEWVLPAGTYTIAVQLDGARADTTVRIEAGKPMALRMPVASGAVHARALTVADGAPLEHDLEWRVTTATDDAPVITRRRRPAPDFILAPGEYRITVRKGAVSAEREVQVHANEVQTVDLVLQGGTLVLDAGEQADGPYWQVESDQQESSVRTFSFQPRPEFTLPPGDYRVRLETRTGLQTETVTVIAGERVELRMGP